MWPQLASLWSDLSQYLEATVVDVLTIEVHASTGLLSQITDHLGFRDRQGCPSSRRVANGCNSSPRSSKLDFPQIVCNFHPLWSNVGLHCCRANLLIGNPCRASFTLSTRLVAMCPATNSSLGVVKHLFASRDFEATRPWVMPDGMCVTAYTAAKLSLLPASPKHEASRRTGDSSPKWRNKSQYN